MPKATTKPAKPAPRDFLVRPGEFAVVESPRFKPWDRLDAEMHGLAAAALFQHQVCWKARAKIAGTFGTTSKFLEKVEVPHPTAVYGKLAGEAWFAPEDFLTWAYHLGRGLLPMSFASPKGPPSLPATWDHLASTPAG